MDAAPRRALLAATGARGGTGAGPTKSASVATYDEHVNMLQITT
jgi:hypothetical protein